MGGLLHLFDFSHSRMARKIHTRKKNDDGLEAPRNSLELQVETSKIDVLYSSSQEEDWHEKNYYPTEVPMKKLINEEISKESCTRQTTPNIVARLMGMDMLPLEAKSSVHSYDKKNDHSAIKSSKKEMNGRSSVAHVPSDLDSSGQIQLDSFYPCRDREVDRCSHHDFENPRPREHPQEEELKKFKKDFEAWQAARFRECSKVVELEGIPTMQKLAQENLNHEKMEFYATSRMNEREKSEESKSLASKSTSYERGGLQKNRHKLELFPTDEKETLLLRRRSKSIDFEPISLMSYDEQRDSAPTRIVILKPGPDRMHDQEDCRTSALETLEGRGSVEDFLEEVKERLKCELTGKNLKKGSVVRGSGIETPFSEKPSESKQIARHIAKHVRERVSRDLGVNLVRSESMRSYRSETELHGPGSPEFFNRDTRRFLSERLRNVLKREKHSDTPVVDSGRSRSSVLEEERIRVKQVGDASSAGNEWNHWEIEKDEQEMQARPFGLHRYENGVFNQDLSPKNLIRSLSAPVQGTSFGQLLLEDRHILTGAQIRRKHEAIEKFSIDVRRRKKEKFNFREKVSNFRYSTFTLRRRLFGKKIQSMIESHREEYDDIKDIRSGPTVIMNISQRHENSTEVPPSPASVCSSSTPRDDFWRSSDSLSTISTPDVTLRGDDAVPQVFRDISSNLNELRRQLKELDNRADDMSSVEAEDDLITKTDQSVEVIEDPAEAYVQELLVASGLYYNHDGSSYSYSCDKYSSNRWRDPLGEPIGKGIFEKVEESYKEKAEENESMKKEYNEKKAERRMLLDLLNEAISSTQLCRLCTTSRFTFTNNICNCRNYASVLRLPSAPRGRKLLDTVWKIISVYVYPAAADRSYNAVDSIVAQDLGCSAWCWSGLMIDEQNIYLGKEMECLIMGELIEEFVNDIPLFIFSHIK